MNVKRTSRRRLAVALRRHKKRDEIRTRFRERVIRIEPNLIFRPLEYLGCREFPVAFKIPLRTDDLPRIWRRSKGRPKVQRLANRNIGAHSTIGSQVDNRLNSFALGCCRWNRYLAVDDLMIRACRRRDTLFYPKAEVTESLAALGRASCPTRSRFGELLDPFCDFFRFAHRCI